jgi:hypothetical protein
MKKLAFLFLIISISMTAQTDQKIYDIIENISEERLKKDVKTLADFGTRNTFSDTISNTRGIGAARRIMHIVLQQFPRSCLIQG